MMPSRMAAGMFGGNPGIEGTSALGFAFGTGFVDRPAFGVGFFVCPDTGTPRNNTSGIIAVTKSARRIAPRLRQTTEVRMTMSQ